MQNGTFLNGNSDDDVRLVFLEVYGSRCQYCGNAVARNSQDRNLWPVIEHIESRANGGNDALENYTLSCFKCNNIKKNKPLDHATLERVRTKALENLPEIKRLLKLKATPPTKRGRPPLGEDGKVVQKGFRFTQALSDDLQAFADADHRTLGNLVTLILQEWVDAHKTD